MEQESNSEPELNEFAQGILSKIPEEDRTVVSKYIKEWDGGVTQHLQKIHVDYEPYKELGDIDDLKIAMEYISLLQNDPRTFIKTVTDAMKEAGMSLNEEDDLEEEFEETPVGIPKEYQQRMDKMEEMLGTMFDRFEGYTTTQEQERQIAQLDKVIDNLHSTHGDFDDDWVLLQIERGKDPKEAVEMYEKKFGSPKGKPPPTLLSANGAVRQDQVDPSKLSNEDKKKYAYQVLMANQDT